MDSKCLLPPSLLHFSTASFVVSTIEISRTSTPPLHLTFLLLKFHLQPATSCALSPRISAMLAAALWHAPMHNVARQNKWAHSARLSHIYMIHIYSCSLLFKFQLYLHSTISHKAAVADANIKTWQLHKKLAKMPPGGRKGCPPPYSTLTNFVAFLCNLLSSWIKYFLAVREVKNF